MKKMLFLENLIVNSKNKPFLMMIFILLSLLVLLFIYFILAFCFSSIMTMVELSTPQVKFDYNNPAFITTPIATLTAAIVTLLSILLVIFQMKQQCKLNSNSAIIEFHRQFESKDMLIHRARLSKFLLERAQAPQLEEYKVLSLNQDQVIQFFETISLLTIEGSFDQEMICREFSLEMLNYYYFLSGLMDSDVPIPPENLPTEDSLISETEKRYCYSPQFFYPNFITLCKKFEEAYGDKKWRTPNFTFEKKKDLAVSFLQLEKDRYNLKSELYVYSAIMPNKTYGDTL